MNPLIKILISSIVLVFASELAKKNTFAAALTMALPFVSILSLVWLAWSGASRDSLASYSLGIFWLVPPSLLFFPVFAWLISRGGVIWGAFIVSALVTLLAYIVYIKILGLFGINV